MKSVLNVLLHVQCDDSTECLNSFQAQTNHLPSIRRLCTIVFRRLQALLVQRIPVFRSLNITMRLWGIKCANMCVCVCVCVPTTAYHRG